MGSFPTRLHTPDTYRFDFVRFPPLYSILQTEIKEWGNEGRGRDLTNVSKAWLFISSHYSLFTFLHTSRCTIVVSIFYYLETRIYSQIKIQEWRFHGVYIHAIENFTKASCSSQKTENLICHRDSQSDPRNASKPAKTACRCQCTDISNRFESKYCIRFFHASSTKISFLWVFLRIKERISLGSDSSFSFTSLSNTIFVLIENFLINFLLEIVIFVDYS